MSDSTLSYTKARATRLTIAIAVTASLLAIFLRWYFVTRAQVLQPLYVASGWGDAAEYYRYAWNLVHHGMFSSDVPGTALPNSDSFRDPAYPAFLALLMSITDNYDRWYALVLLAQATLGGVTVLCAVLAIRDALPPWLLAASAILLAIWPHLVAIPAYVLSENITAPLFALTALVLTEAVRRSSVILSIVGGVTLACASLTNAVLTPLIVPLAIVFAWKRVLPRRHIVAMALAVTLPLLAWGIRNSSIHGPFSSSFRAEVNLVQGSWPTYHTASQLAARHDFVGTQTIEAIDLEIAAVHLDRWQGIRAMGERMSAAPTTYIGWYLSKPLLLWGWEIALGAGDIYVYPTRNSPFITNPAMRAIEAVTYVLNRILALLAAVGAWYAFRRPRPSAAMILFATTVIWVTCVYGALQSDARYSIPFRTAEIGLACYASAIFASYVRGRFRPMARPG